VIQLLETNVIGLTRSGPKQTPVDYVDKHYGVWDLPQMLKEADYVCAIMPSTKETNNLLGGEVLKAAQGVQQGTIQND